MTVRPNSDAARDIANYIHPYTNLVKHQKDGPVIMTKGKGIYVYDEDGKEYIEALAGLWCTSLGFGEEELIEAAIKQMRDLPTYHNFFAKSMLPGIGLAEKLIEMAPVPMSKVFFANSGSEANDTLIKMIWYINNATGRHKRKKIISRRMAYHGITIGAGSLTGIPANHQAFDLPIPNILHTEFPHYYRNGEPGETEEEFSQRMADELEKLIVDQDPETVAAFIAEPVMGAGGVVPPPKGYFEKVQAVLDKYDVMFLADEVITGFGRTGNMFATETYDLKPAAMTLAKALSSAYLPISAVMVNEEIFDAMAEQSNEVGLFAHGFTYSGHPVPSAVALRTLELYEERDLLGHVRRVMPTFQKRLHAFADHPLVGEVRGVGLIGAIEFVAEKETKRQFEATHAVTQYCLKRANEYGVMTRAMPHVMGFCPPLIITEDEINDLFDRMEKAFNDTEEWVSSNALRAAA